MVESVGCMRLYINGLNNVLHYIKEAHTVLNVMSQVLVSCILDGRIHK